MNIIIVGGGKVGYTLAKYLSLEHDNVTIIDKNEDALERINNNLDVMCIKGTCTNLKVLYEAGIEETDILISVTDSDELNMLCSLAAKKLGVKHTVARVRTPDYDEDISLLTEAIGIDLVINPEKAVATEIAKRIKFPSVCSIDSFSHGQVNLVGFKVTEKIGLAGKKISDIDFVKGNVIFCGIERDDEVIIPNGDYVFHEDDRIYVIGEHREIQTLFKKLGKYKTRVKNSMIIGGGKISYYLAKAMEEIGVNCKIVEKEIEKCEELTELLPDSIIINGDGMDQDLLHSERVTAMDSFITLMGRDEDNLIASIFAANNNVDNIITKITRDNYNEIATSVGINSIVNTKLITSYKIIKYVRTLKNKRGSSIRHIRRICNEKAEAIEFLIGDKTLNKNIKLKELNLIDDLLVSTILRNNKIIIPTGDDCLKNDDRVIIVTKNTNLLDINDIFLGGES
ncbi:Trk system potassium transporter TrkA [Clostridium sp.]|uniref:Trk system potassium transporter TrkA n=1 Tax=Clostridium sp. TaxID=1506 RepID=UPI003F3E7C74